MTKRKTPLAREQVSQFQLHLCRWHKLHPPTFHTPCAGWDCSHEDFPHHNHLLKYTFLAFPRGKYFLESSAKLQLLFTTFQVNAIWTKDMGTCFKKSHWDHQPISKMSLSNMLNLIYITSSTTTHFPYSGLDCCKVEPNPIWIYLEIYLVDTKLSWTTVHDLMVWNTTVLSPVWFYFTGFTSLYKWTGEQPAHFAQRWEGAMILNFTARFFQNYDCQVNL